MTITRKSSRASRRTRPRPGDWKVLEGGLGRVRWSRIQTAQARIVSGYYEREEVQSYVVTQILKELKRH